MVQEASDRTGIAIARSIWRWGGWVPGGTLAAAARQLLVQSGGGAMVDGALQAVGAALLVGGVSVILIWVGYTCWKISPSQRLKLLEKDLIRVRNDLRIWRNMDEVRMEDTSSARTIIRKLDRLKIPRPPISERGSIWYVYINRIIGEASAGAIGESRLVWREMRGSNATDA